MSDDETSSSAASSASRPRATTRTPSLTNSFWKHLPSPRSFRHATQRLSSSPLAAAHVLPSPILEHSTTAVNGTMTTPVSSTRTPPSKAYLPLSVRTSSLYPFDFDFVKTKEAVENGQLALPSPSTGTGHHHSNHDYPSSHEVSPVTTRSSSDIDSPKERNLHEPETASGRTSKLNGWQIAADRMSTTSPIPSRDNLVIFNTGYASTLTVTPSKNNLGNLVREMQTKRDGHKFQNRTASMMTQTSMTSSTTQIRHDSVSMMTPRYSGGEKDSPRASFMALLSPRSGKKTRSFGAAEFFGGRIPSASTELGNSDEVVGDLEFLCSQPPPDLGQHPMMTMDPFTSHSIASSMSTQMNVTQTRQWSLDYFREKKERWTEKQVRPFVKGEPFPVFKQPEWIVKEQDRGARQVAEAARMTSQSTKQEILASQASPVPKSSKTPKTPLRIDTEAANSPMTDIHVATLTATPLTNDTFKKSGSASIRNFSNFFKSRVSTDRRSLSSGAQEAVSPECTREEPRARKERYLRTITNCPTFDYSPTSVYPRHPNTGRDWRSRNLRCAGCQWVTCHTCGRACCARAACFYAMENHKENPAGMERAQEIKAMIESIIPTDREVQTFLTCTSCNREVCPDCCGMCPHEACQDIQCQRCKRGDPWDECDWHRDLMMAPREKSAAGSTVSTI